MYEQSRQDQIFKRGWYRLSSLCTTSYVFPSHMSHHLCSVSTVLSILLSVWTVSRPPDCTMISRYHEARQVTSQSIFLESTRSHFRKLAHTNQQANFNCPAEITSKNVRQKPLGIKWYAVSSTSFTCDSTWRGVWDFNAFSRSSATVAETRLEELKDDMSRRSSRKPGTSGTMFTNKA